eukprot:CAMPEP_0117424948 /NCGR_PEP_ID=MMETSP0758-20121206/5291_1 /TAXON_ID=63605 /ORGANISM="Percolomonas cosmopolitus, Strain AE-1 (ATCC 50343)" /LENGTH=277 /DNA_ID=CAMNT_0005209085 /DNA_START=167 /DNA_END=997 /DNA_ORIENTATION=+
MEKNAHLPDLPAEAPNRRSLNPTNKNDYECLTDQINEPLIREARATNAITGRMFKTSSPYAYLNNYSNEIPSCGFTICDARFVRNQFTSKRSKNYKITFWVNGANEIGKNTELAQQIAQEAINELTAAYTDSTGFTFSYTIKQYGYQNRKSIMVSTDEECTLASNLGYQCLFPSQIASSFPDYNKGFNIFMEDRMARDTNNGWAYLPATPYHSIVAIKKDALRSGHTTIVHELAHAFGLAHVFHKFDKCDDQCHEGDFNGHETGDLVSDTRPIPINW